MKALSILVAWATLATAMPTVPSGSKAVTDPAKIAELGAKHATSLENQRLGNALAIGRQDGKTHLLTPKNKRQIPLVTVIAGVFAELLSPELLDAAAFALKLAEDLDRAMGVEPAIWDSEEHCRVTFYTHSGGNERIYSYDEGSGTADTDSETDKGWINPASSAPPVFYFDDESLGSWSLQFTATDGYAWSGINNTEKCHIEGLCNPQIIFYRDKYNIIINTWQSQGTTSDCYYHNNCEGLCNSGVQNQFESDGVLWGGKCAVPCIGEAQEAGSSTAPGGPSKSTPLKFMLVGDSISHGMEGDFTWRWRIYYWLQSLGYNIQFVGPYSGTLGPSPQIVAEPAPPLLPGETATTFTPGPGDYNSAVPDGFVQTGHGAYWGRQAMQVKNTIGDWVATYQPDYILVMLGFNDLGWFVSGPDGLIGSMGALVENAREKKADVQFLVANVVDRLFITGRDDLVANTAAYNEQLRDTIPHWFRWESPIAYVDVNSNYQCKPDSCPDGYDGLHPDSMGEYHIAQAFAGVLKNSFGFEGNDFSVPGSAEGRDISVPAGVIAEGLAEGMFTGWLFQEYARGYEVRSRIQGMADWWSSSRVYPFTTASVDPWVETGQTWEYQVRTLGDGTAASDWSGSVFATANVKTASGPTNIVSMPVGADGIQVSWSPVTDHAVNRYGVIVWDQDTPGAFIDMQATTGTSYTFTGLVPGHRYGTWVSTYVTLTGTLTGQSMAAGGLPASGREVIVGGGTPAPPTGLSVVNNDPTTITLTWSSTASAAGYAVYYISVRSGGTPTVYTMAGNTSDTTYQVAFLFPGTWNYQFCVSAYNGNSESAYTDCVIPAVYPGYTQNDKRMDVPDNTTSVTNDTITANPWTNPKLQQLHQLVMQNETLYAQIVPSQ